MILKLNTNGTITIEPMIIPEPLESIYISYIFPKGLNYLQPILYWGGETFIGDNIRISKSNKAFNMRVELINHEDESVKEYILNVEPDMYVGYNIKKLEPNIIQYLELLADKNKELEEKGDII